MKILIIEDDSKTAQFIIKGLKQEGFSVDHASNGNKGLNFALNEFYDIAIIDIMLPGKNGIEIITEMRRSKIETPVIILSAKSSTEDKVNGLISGSDDYLSKPFAFSELIARIQALLRRSQKSIHSTVLNYKDLKLDLNTRKVHRNETEIELQPKEFSLLEYLLKNAGRVVSKTMIMEHVWDYNFDPQTTVVESRICHLREKIDKDFDTSLIHTVRGVGYVLEERL